MRRPAAVARSRTAARKFTPLKFAFGARSDRRMHEAGDVAAEARDLAHEAGADVRESSDGTMKTVSSFGCRCRFMSAI